MPDESCRKCGGELRITRCRECRFPTERICKCCQNMIRYVYHYCTRNLSSMPYACVANA